MCENKHATIEPKISTLTILIENICLMHKVNSSRDVIKQHITQINIEE